MRAHRALGPGGALPRALVGPSPGPWWGPPLRPAELPWALVGPSPGPPPLSSGGALPWALEELFPWALLEPSRSLGPGALSGPWRDPPLGPGEALGPVGALQIRRAPAEGLPAVLDNLELVALFG